MLAPGIRAAVLLLCVAGLASAQTVVLVTQSDPPVPAPHGLRVLEHALRTKGLTVKRATSAENETGDYYIRAQVVDDQSASPEALSIRKAQINGKPALEVRGAGARGLMYAALDVAERVGWAKGSDPFAEVRMAMESPYLAGRAVSIYTMQRAYFESRLYDEKYWERYFDLLAQCRINSFLVIFGYENGGFLAPPYPYFFDVEGFPDVKMIGLTAEQQQKNAAALHALIRIAHERGIAVEAGIWDHIYRGGVQAGGIPGASENASKPTPGLVWGLNAENLAPYTKAALRRFLAVFPEIDALQFRMHTESGLKREEMQSFWHDVFGMIHELRPELRVDLRAKDLPDPIIDDALEQGLRVRVTTKYWMEQMGLPFHPSHVNPQDQKNRRHGYADLLSYPQRYQVHWRLWNGGTTRLLLWGDDEYVRRFAESARLFDGDSFEVNEMLATWMLGEPHDSPPHPVLNDKYRFFDYDFERYWLFYRLWGRLTYNPATPQEIWRLEFVRRYGAEAGAYLERALQMASGVLPRIVASSYRYALFPTTRGWAEMMREGDLPQFAGEEGSDTEQFESVREEVRRILAGTDTAKRRPQDSALWFQRTANRLLAEVRHAALARDARRGPEFTTTVTDLRILAALAHFHAARLQAAVAYNLYKETGDLWIFDDAVAHEKNSTVAWEQIVVEASDVYRTDLSFGAHAVGFPHHWSEELERLRAGLVTLEAERAKAGMAVAPGPLRIAHVPVRILSMASPLTLRATTLGEVPAKEMKAVIRIDEGEPRTLPMRMVEPGRFRGQLVFVPKVSRIRYHLEATDEQGHTVTSPGGEIEVLVSEDRDPPLVQLQRASLARPGQDLVVLAKAEDPSGVKSVKLHYRHLTQFEDYNTVEMTLDPATGAYTARIPGEFITARWDLMYFVEAIDGAHNGVIVPDLDREAPYVIVPVAR